MNVINIIGIIVLVTTIVEMTIWGGRFLALPIKAKLLWAGGWVVLMATWLVLAHTVGS